MGAKRISVVARIGLPLAVAVASAASGWSCSIIIDKNADQCSTNNDCTAKGGLFAGRVCVDHVCVDKTSSDAIAEVGDTAVPDTAADSAPIEADVSSDAGDPTAGIFVLGGTTATGGVLVVVDPSTGAELSRETMVVNAVAYDPGVSTGGGDVWYVFEQGASTDAGLPGSKLHVRTYNPAAKAWTEITHLDGVPTPLSPTNVVVMNKRLYIMAAPGAGADPLAVGELFIVDVSNSGLPSMFPGPANVVKKSASTDVYLGTLTGGRADDSLTGGTIGVAFSQACTGTPQTCPVFFQRFRYTGNDGPDVFGTQPSFGSYTTDVSVGFGSSPLAKAAFMIVPTSTTAGQLLQNSQTFFGPPDTVGNFTYSGRPTFSVTALDDCDGVALFTTFSNKLYAVPYSSTGLTATSIEGALASQISFEPKSKVVAYVSSGSPQAARVSTAPALNLSQVAWPTRDFTTTLVVARAPMKVCAI